MADDRLAAHQRRELTRRSRPGGLRQLDLEALVAAGVGDRGSAGHR